jgi:iron complex outermembrane recepter protein
MSLASLSLLLLSSTSPLPATVPSRAESPVAVAMTDEADTETTQDHGEIVVTARRRQESVQDVPLAITVVDAAQINDTGASSIYKVQQLAPTLQVYSQNPRNTAVNIRGIGVPFGLTNDGFEAGVGIYVDDVYYARVASAVFDFLDVSQVEVLRGPQGTLYGKNTTAGAINIRTNQPTFDFEGKAELSLGNYNFKQAKVAVSGPLSDKVAARIALSTTNRRGTIYNVNGGNWINAQDNLGLRGQLLFRPNDNLNITLAGDWSAQDPECCGTVFVRYGPTQRAAARQYPALIAQFPNYSVSTDPFARRTNLDASLNAGNKTGGASLRAVWDLSASDTVTSVTAWRFWDWKPENDRDYTGLSITSKSQNPSQQDQYSQEFRYNHTGKDFNFVLGAFGFYQRVDIQGTEQAGADSALWNLTGTNATHSEYLNGLTARNTQWLKATSLALFGQIEWKVSDRFSIQPGARLNYDKKDGFYQREVFDPQGNPVPASGGTAINAQQRNIYVPQLVDPSFSAWNFSYDVTARYKLTRDVLLYGTYAKTFKTGGINLNGLPVDANNVPIRSADTIKPESVNHFELGIKSQFWDRRVTFNLSAYRTTIDNFQANVSNGQIGIVRGYLANADQVRSQGIELDFSVRPSERFSAYLNGAYTDAKYTKFCDAPPPPELAGGTTLPVVAGTKCSYTGTVSAPGTAGGNSPPFVDASGRVLPGVSKWSLSYGAEGNIPGKLLGKDGQFYLGVDQSYRSKFSSNPTPSIYTWVKGYGLTNVRLGFRGDPRTWGGTISKSF